MTFPPFDLRWFPELNSYGLFHESSCTPMALHHNAHTLHVLGEAIRKGDTPRALRQADYIRACGGLTTDGEILTSLRASAAPLRAETPAPKPSSTVTPNY